jgi:large subunit ribosomal protein L25
LAFVPPRAAEQESIVTNFVTIDAEARPRAGKGAARATRRAGKVPAVIYGAKQAADLIALDPRSIIRELQRGGWRSRLFEVRVNGSATRALIRDVQFHPVSDRPEHVDFQRLAPGQQIRVAVVVHFDNELASPGIKRGGVLNVVRHTVEVWCDPDNVPETFHADLTGLDFHDGVRWHDLKGTEGTRPVIADRDFLVASVAPPTKLVEATGEEAAAATAAAAPAAAAPAKSSAPAKGAAPAKPAAKK